MRGETKFFLQPGEELIDDYINDMLVLEEGQAILLRANQDYPAAGKKAGETWMIQGPTEYIPPIEVDVIDTR